MQHRKGRGGGALTGAANLPPEIAMNAMAAVQARANGWPPAVRPATVKVAFAA